MHQNWDQVSADLQYGPPVAKASRRSYPNDFVDKSFLDFLLAENVQAPGPSSALSNKALLTCTEPVG